MRKNGQKLFICFLLCIIFISACGNAGLDNLKKSVSNISSTMTGHIEDMRNINTEFANTVEKLYATAKWDEIDISKMDVEDGGEYKLFQGKMYYRANADKKDIPLLVSMGSMDLNDNIKKVLKLYEGIGNELKEKYNSHKYASRISFISLNGEAISYPFLDAPSAFPVGLDFSQLPWYKDAMTNNKEKGKFDYPVVATGPDGWVISILKGIYVNGEPIGELNCDILLLKMITSLVADETNMVIIAYKDTIVFGASKPARKTLGVKVLEQFDYLELMKENPDLNIADTLKLVNKDQSAGLQKLGKIILNEKQIDKDEKLELNGKSYNVIIEKVDVEPEKGISFFVIGLL